MYRLAFVLPLLLLPAFAQEKPDAWMQDFAKAQEKAKAEKKDLLIDFTGSDWCGWCIKLDKEVFAQEGFQSAAPRDFVLVKLDFPQDESLVTPEIKAQNEKLGKQYNIQGYPTILLTDADGVVYGQTGYEAGGPEKYVAMLAEKRKQGTAFKAAMQRAATVQGGDRAKALDEALSAIDAEVVSGHHLATMEEIVKLDAEGKAQLKPKYEAKVREIAEARELDAEAQAIDGIISPIINSDASEAEKATQAMAKLDELIQAPKNKMQHQMALFFKGMVAMRLKRDTKAATEAFEAAKAVLPTSQVAKQIEQQILPQLKKQAEGGEKGGK